MSSSFLRIKSNQPHTFLVRRGTLITDQESIMPPVTIGLRNRPWYGKNFLFDLNVLRKISNCSLSMYWAGAETASSVSWCLWIQQPRPQRSRCQCGFGAEQRASAGTSEGLKIGVGWGASSNVVEHNLLTHYDWDKLTDLPTSGRGRGRGAPPSAPLFRHPFVPCTRTSCSDAWKQLLSFHCLPALDWREYYVA